MKRHLLINAIVLVCMTFVSCTINIDGESLGVKTIKGDGNIVSRDYDVSAFEDLSLALPATVNFTVGDDYTCTVRVDENIMEYLEVEVDDNTLYLRRQDGHKTVNLRATTFVIDVTAPRLEDIYLAGSGTLNVLSPLEGEEMDVNLAGSGDIVFNETITVQKIDLSVAGSGDLVCTQLIADNLDATIAGSGDLKVAGGTVRKAEADVAGSGDIALLCDIENLQTDVAGSGDVKARVSGKLKYHIVGSGDIGYYGNPVVEGDKVGSGSVTRLGD